MTTSKRSPAGAGTALQRRGKGGGNRAANRHNRARVTSPMHTGSDISSLFVTTELNDFVKAGGLGDVSAALPRALRASHDVRILLPGYRCVLDALGPFPIVGRTRPVAGIPACDIGEAQTRDGLQILVLCHAHLFDRPGNPYGDAGVCWPDNALRFATLSSAAADIAQGKAGLDWQPRLLHLNDWPTALAAAYLRWRGGRIPSMLTIHNLAYQGVFPRKLCTSLGLMLDDAELSFHGNVSFLRAGIAHADVCTTVSRSYARQIVTAPFGCGLDALLARRARQGRLHGIVNGIDASWSSVSDPALVERFQPGDWERRLQNKLAIQHSCRLRPGTGPLFGIVSRLVHQKGIDMVCAAIPQIVAAGGQLVIMGGGEPDIEQAVREMQQRFSSDVAGPLPFDEAASRVVFAGADFLLMPSRFEPCGLSQMYAQAYGCLPIAHATGGLLDTVDDGVTGLLFGSASTMSMRHALQRAFRLHQQTALLDSMRLAAMLEPRNWQGAARQYAALYDSTLQTQIAA